MAALGSPDVVCADNVGDELGMPLPCVNAEKMNIKNRVISKPLEPQKSIVSASAVLMEFRKQIASAFSPTFEGLQPFEAVLFD
ncbi:hypothetical protein RHMOL_Rhmol02G0315600 [Rhododendron molle]|uniref:Uncharacterized protein n=1 Tax=Rhododendron molle TaxID=49168 RepID=A0ACC0PWR9_RHOML|nr:hypothetical protein RHMOL_Rhmol02G0315600 [Rhododendron molle]